MVQRPKRVQRGGAHLLSENEEFQGNEIDLRRAALVFDVFGTLVDHARSVGRLTAPAPARVHARSDWGDTHQFTDARSGYLLALHQIGTGGPATQL